MIKSLKLKATWMGVLLLAAGVIVGSLAIAQEGSGPEGSGPTKEAQKAESVDEADLKPALIVVKIHADWCATCKKMGPILEDLTQRLGEDTETLIVKVDLTNDATKRQSRLLMNALGLSKVYHEHTKKTGVLLLVDPEDANVVKTLTSEMTAAQMEQAIRAASPAPAEVDKGVHKHPDEGSATKPEGSAPKMPEGSASRPMEGS
jgi:thiol:disulfide interchange protein